MRVKGDVPGDGPPCKAVPAIASGTRDPSVHCVLRGRLLSPMARGPASTLSIPDLCVLLGPWEPSQIPAWASGGER